MNAVEGGQLAAPPSDLLSGASLFLDFDGTLVEVAERPDAVRVDARLRGLMRRLAERLDGRLAVITGRGAGQLCELFGAPDFTVAGSHGLEFLYPDGRSVVAPRPAGLDAAITTMRARSREWPGVLVEDKPLGAALHFRQNPEAEQECVALVRTLAKQHGLGIQTGKMMIELRGLEGDKGSAVRTLMAQPPMAGTRPVFLGDDDTDEAGIAAAEALGGAGILIGAVRPTAARYRLPGVASTLDWLERACAA